MLSLQRLQEIDQVLHLLRRKADLKTFVIETHDLRKVRRRTVMKIRRPGAKTPQDRTLDAADSCALP